MKVSRQTGGLGTSCRPFPITLGGSMV